MTLPRRSLLKGLFAGTAAAVAAPALPHAATAAAPPRPAASVIAVVAGSPLDDAFLDQARRLGAVTVERLAGDALSRHRRIRALLARGRHVLALLPDADAVLFREAVRHAGGSLPADRRAGAGLVSLVAHV